MIGKVPEAHQGNIMPSECAICTTARLASSAGLVTWAAGRSTGRAQILADRRNSWLRAADVDSGEPHPPPGPAGSPFI